MSTPKVILRKGANEEITFTIRASEATLERLASLLLFAEIVTKEQLARRKAAAQGPLPWEDPNDERFVPVPPTTDELIEEATKLISAIANSFVGGLEDVKKILTSFGVPRLSELPVEQLPQFIDALRRMPPAVEETDPDDLV